MSLTEPLLEFGAQNQQTREVANTFPERAALGLSATTPQTENENARNRHPEVRLSQMRRVR
jgi:hypothetical protein